MLDTPSSKGRGCSSCNRSAFTYEYPGGVHARCLRARQSQPGRCSLAARTRQAPSLPDLCRPGRSDVRFPTSRAQIENYAAAHAASMEFVGARCRLPGGEVCKNDPDAISQPARIALAARRSTGTPLRLRSAAARCWTRSAMPRRSSTAASATFASRRRCWRRMTAASASRTPLMPFGLKNLDRHLCAALGDHQRQRLHRHACRRARSAAAWPKP